MQVLLPGFLLPIYEQVHLLLLFQVLFVAKIASFEDLRENRGPLLMTFAPLDLQAGLFSLLTFSTVVREFLMEP